MVIWREKINDKVETERSRKALQLQAKSTISESIEQATKSWKIVAQQNSAKLEQSEPMDDLDQVSFFSQSINNTEQIDGREIY